MCTNWSLGMPSACAFQLFSLVCLWKEKTKVLTKMMIHFFYFDSRSVSLIHVQMHECIVFWNVFLKQRICWDHTGLKTFPKKKKRPGISTYLCALTSGPVRKHAQFIISTSSRDFSWSKPPFRAKSSMSSMMVCEMSNPLEMQVS